LPEQGKVVRVIDGDTVELESGQRVRYLGIDAPELRRRTSQAWVYDPEPYAELARRRNVQLVEGRSVRLEYDRRIRDRYGRLLAYVYTEDGMVNAQLLEEGLAEVLVIPPNSRYAERLHTHAQAAKQRRRGLWR
jgi:micrococcal nuclease